jgi:hypothetical protein
MMGFKAQEEASSPQERTSSNYSKKFSHPVLHLSLVIFDIPDPDLQY